MRKLWFCNNKKKNILKFKIYDDANFINEFNNKNPFTRNKQINYSNILLTIGKSTYIF